MQCGWRTLLAQAVEAEVADFLAKHAGLGTEVAVNASLRDFVP
jgi:hypothetical protein